MAESTKIYMGVPQTTKLPVYDTKKGNKVTITKIILTNTEEKNVSGEIKVAKATVTVNTMDVMKNIEVAAGETKLLDVFIVLEENDVLSLQQDTINAINVTVCGLSENTYQ
ncbi:hypothetical protein ICW_05611 [Bacillus wiedmannii]|uniref:hypothetical protein n=1 Tax=Bacillus wiedmannii TaxID=1890302 RepID=UPI00027AB776|nr:hypothetical protein [Bacillus wiedmannii]EJS62948.1 hypothetical protein ICW_05611 [Bacillus wiedmannii]